ncbi:DUF3404 domain-containing protein [Dongshaea marina]|uniref:DUF3404 domain-containing protein n=1 Tax=Dongshaea marina TaxID=2047966 RepID=UPI000D3EC695|nr:DUF3404 domain-containing protein [Dongshaea marina]
MQPDTSYNNPLSQSWFTMIVLPFLLLLLLLPAPGIAKEPLASRWQEFTRQLEAQGSSPLVTAKALGRYPRALLVPQNQYPQLKTESWSQLLLLNQLRHNCTPPLHRAVGDKAVEFELAQCSHERLRVSWFRKSPWLHPAGGSYAGRYIKAHPDLAQAELKKLRPWVTLKNPYHPLHEALKSLSDDELTQLLEGTPWLLSQKNLWLQTRLGIYRFPHTRWKPLADSYNIRLTQTTGNYCALSQGRCALIRPLPPLPVPLPGCRHHPAASDPGRTDDPPTDPERQGETPSAAAINPRAAHSHYQPGTHYRQLSPTLRRPQSSSAKGICQIARR